MARGDDLVLRVTADTTQVASGLAPLRTALDGVESEAANAQAELAQLDSMRVTPEIELSLQDQAIAHARGEIDRLREKIAEDIIMGVDTRTAERRLSSLQASIRRLEPSAPIEIPVEVEDVPPIEVEIDVEETGAQEGLAGIESLREGVVETTAALGDLNNGFSGLATLGQALVPALADLNETMLDLQDRARASGRELGGFGRAVSGITSVMAGPWGLAIAAGVGLLSVFSMKQDEAEAETQALSEAIDFQAGAFDRNNRSQAAQLLNQDELLATAEKLGVSTQDLTSAILGNDDAYNRVRAQMQGAAEASRSNLDEVINLGDGLDELRERNQGVADTQGLLNRAIGDTADEMGDAADATEDAVDSWAEYNSAVGDARTKLDGLIDSMDIYNGRLASVQEATASYEEGLDDLTDAVKSHVKAKQDESGMFDLTTEKGREYDRMVRGQAESLDALTKARLADSDGSEEATNEIVTDYAKQRASLIKTAEKLGMSEEAAKKYVDALLATPKEVKTQARVTGTQAAETELEKLTRQRDTEVTVKVNVDAQRISQQIVRAAQRARQIAEGALDEGARSGRSAPPPAAPPVYVSPRIYLDSVPIRAALRGDVSAVVGSAMTSATTARRPR